MSETSSEAPAWSVEAARSLYNVDRWGAGYFDIGADGHVVARPLHDKGAEVDITDVIGEARGRGLRFPLLIRFQDILRHRVRGAERGVPGGHHRVRIPGALPWCVPDQGEPAPRGGGGDPRCGASPYEFGLEVGSKPEMFAGLALQNPVGGLIICNGYKDATSSAWRCWASSSASRSSWWWRSWRNSARSSPISRQMGVEPPGRDPRPVAGQRRGQMGGERRRECQVRTEHGGDPGGAATCSSAEKLGHCFKLAAFPHRLAGARHSDRQEGGAGGGAVLREAATRLGFAHRITWTSAAGWGWTTTAAVPRSTARRTTRCRNTPTTSFITSPTSATPRKSRTRTS